MTKQILKVNWNEIVLFQQNEKDFISLTDIAKRKNSEFPADVIKNWLRNKFTLEFIWTWEKINNIDFKLVEFDQFKSEAWSNAFVMTPKKWIESTNAIWIISKSWKYGWTFAHKDIALEFASWISPEFKLYIIKEFQRLKEEEKRRELSGWDIKRSIASVNYKIQTDSIKLNLIPTISEFEQKYAYANEADLINLIIFWKTAKMWEEENPELAKNWNMRDYADVIELIILSNLESFNADYLEQWLTRKERFEKLSKIAQTQKQSLLSDKKLINFKKITN